MAGRWRVAGLAAILMGALVACDDNRVGPCVHTYNVALLQIAGAHDAHDGMIIPNIVIRNVRRDGMVQDLQFLVAVPAYGVEIQGDSLVCRVPCGFATQEGNYIFTVSATGYAPQDRGYEARYAVFHGGCPSYNDVGVRIVLALRRGG